ncbi:thiamine phosphate synthase, partial [Parvibaculum sp.]|uniref:thiamine phosphate synthase n=1 Tax=Parvibaculum sp. TaxID=2024848 RepID=UPI003C7474F3
AIRLAAAARVDAVLISPVFPTESHPGGKTLGLIRLAQLARHARSLNLKPYALGGIITPTHISRLSGTGVEGVAGIGFLL